MGVVKWAVCSTNPAMQQFSRHCLPFRAFSALQLSHIVEKTDFLSGTWAVAICVKFLCRKTNMSYCLEINPQSLTCRDSWQKFTLMISVTLGYWKLVHQLYQCSPIIWHNLSVEIVPQLGRYFLFVFLGPCLTVFRGLAVPEMNWESPTNKAYTLPLNHNPSSKPLKYADSFLPQVSASIYQIALSDQRRE